MYYSVFILLMMILMLGAARSHSPIISGPVINLIFLPATGKSLFDERLTRQSTGRTRQMLWVDKYRPRKLEKLSFNADLTAQLQKIAAAVEIPHMLFYGPSASGKKTRVMALLRQIFGTGVEKVKLDHRRFKTPSKRNVDITMISSNYHVEVNPSDAGLNDRYVVQEVIKEMAQSHSLSTLAWTKNGNSNPEDNSSSSSLPDSKKPMHRQFKVLVLSDVDSLSHQAQASLRRTMEKYASSCRLILICRSPCRVIAPVRSRCLGIRVPSPTNEEITEGLFHVAKKEGSLLILFMDFDYITETKSFDKTI